MPSVISNLSREIREVARMSGPCQSGVRDAVEASIRLASNLPAQPSAADARIAAALRTAKRHAGDAGRALESFAQEADAFADRLADGTASHPVLGGLRAGALVGDIVAVALIGSVAGAAAPLAEIDSAAMAAGASNPAGVERSALHTAAAVHEAFDAAEEMTRRAKETSDAVSSSPEQTNSLIVDPPRRHGGNP